MTVSRIGYYGKLPARADFVGRRLPDDFIKHWDGWLQAALSIGEAAGSERWRQHFLASPTWRFALPAGVCGHGGWIGALRPSMDAVGRCFPFVLAVELPTPVDIVTLVDAGTGWFATLEAAAGAIARPDFELDWLTGHCHPWGHPRARCGWRGACVAVGGCIGTERPLVRTAQRPRRGRGIAPATGRRSARVDLVDRRYAGVRSWCCLDPGPRTPRRIRRPGGRIVGKARLEGGRGCRALGQSGHFPLEWDRLA